MRSARVCSQLLFGQDLVRSDRGRVVVVAFPNLFWKLQTYLTTVSWQLHSIGVGHSECICDGSPGSLVLCIVLSLKNVNIGNAFVLQPEGSTFRFSGPVLVLPSLFPHSSVMYILLLANDRSADREAKYFLLQKDNCQYYAALQQWLSGRNVPTFSSFFKTAIKQTRPNKTEWKSWGDDRRCWDDSMQR